MEKYTLTRFYYRPFASQLNLKLRLTYQASVKMMFRGALREEFSEFTNDHGNYREPVGECKSTWTSPTLNRIHCDLFRDFLLYKTATIELIFPHTAEQIRGLTTGPMEKLDEVSWGDSIMKLQWPELKRPIPHFWLLQIILMILFLELE